MSLISSIVAPLVRSFPYRILLSLALFATTLVLNCAAQELPSNLPPVVVLAPVNFDSSTPVQLEAGLRPTEKLLEGFLRHKRVEVVTVPRDEMVAAYNAEMSERNVQTNDGPEHDALMSSLLEKFSPRPADSVLIVPNILFRVAELKGTNAKWDGTVRFIDVETPVGMPEYDGIFKDPASRGVSIQIRVYDSNNVQRHEGYGGITVPWKYVLEERTLGRRHDGYLELIDLTGQEIFDDPKQLARAIAVAFAPYVPRKF